MRRLLRSQVLLFAMLLVACEGPAGPSGASAIDSAPGAMADGAPGPHDTQPGVALAITDLAFAGTAASVEFTLTDGSGVGVDPSGLLTTGTVELGFVVSQLATNADGAPGQCTAYTTLVQTSPITGASATQATTESNGALHVLDPIAGTYRYDVVARLTGVEASATQTVAGVRDPRRVQRARPARS